MSGGHSSSSRFGSNLGVGGGDEKERNETEIAVDLADQSVWRKEEEKSLISRQQFRRWRIPSRCTRLALITFSRDTTFGIDTVAFHFYRTLELQRITHFSNRLIAVEGLYSPLAATL